MHNGSMFYQSKYSSTSQNLQGDKGENMQNKVKRFSVIMLVVIFVVFTEVAGYGNKLVIMGHSNSVIPCALGSQNTQYRRKEIQT